MFSFSKKIILSLIITSLTISGVFIPNPKNIQAVPVEVTTDIVSTMGFQKLAAILSGVAPGQQQDTRWASVKILVVKGFLKRLTESIVTWIDSGFKGNPAFITNTKQFLLNTADKTVGDFLMQDASLNFLCDPFKLQIKLALGLQYRPFKEQIECSFTSAVGNVTDAMNSFTNGDFIGGGGWDSWLQMTTVPQNNQMGAMMIAQSELDARISGNKEIQLAEADWGGGFMSWKDCPETQGYTAATESAMSAEADRTRFSEVTGQERGEDNCVIKTPGGVIASKINWVDSSNIRQLELANDFNAIINALANQVILQGMGALKNGGLLGNKKPKEDTSYIDYMNYLNTIDTQLYGSNNSDSYNSDGSIDSTVSYANKNIALETINRQIGVEAQYLGAQNNLNDLLNAVENTIGNSSCSDSIKTSINEQISGNYTGSKDLSWNKKDIANASNRATGNIALLNSVRNSISNSTSDTAIPGIVQPLTTASFDTIAEANSYSDGGTKYNNIKNWIVSKVNNNKSCIGNNISNLSEWGIQ